MTIQIPEIPPSWNKFAGRQNTWEYREEKQRWAWLIRAAIEQQSRKPIEGKAVVCITYFFPTHGRRDPDNYSGKFLLDGLVAAGVLQDDSFACIELRLRAEYDKHHPRTEITINHELAVDCKEENHANKSHH